MTVDLDAIARRGRCDVSHLRLALPLLEQGYTPPFLARYRRDELGGIDEGSLWGLAHAVHAEQAIAARRDELHSIWEQTTLADPSLGYAIRKANSKRMLDRLGRRLKLEISSVISPSVRLAVRVMNPQRGDAEDLAQLAASTEGIEDAEAAVAGLDAAIAKRLAGDPRIISAAVRWLSKNARIYIANVSDPHTGGGDDDDHEAAGDHEGAGDHDSVVESELHDDVALVDDAAAMAGLSADDEAGSDKPKSVSVGDVIEAVDQAGEAPAAAESIAASESVATDSTTTGDDVTADDVTAQATEPAEATEAAAEAAPAEAGKPAPQAKAKKGNKGDKKGSAAAAKKVKRVSPRQRRRRWLISVLQPLAGKRVPASKLGSFQILMLSRALRSQVAQCSFEYDAARLVAEIQQTALGLSREHGERLSRIALEHEADIREASEGAWWDELQEQASTRLVSIAGDQLRRVINRGGVEAKVVMSIDAVGPRTAATTIVAADGRILHSEDLPCQLSAALRSQAVSRMGELIHTHGVDLIVISNGPARRASMVAVGDLLAQSPEKSLRWTLADRSGADAYAGSSTADQEMRTTPRRFRAAAWLAFSVLHPAQAIAKVDPLKLRLVSFQRELTDEVLADTLDDVMISGASRGGVDVNSAPATWLSRLPGVNESIAKQIDSRRRSNLFASRSDLEAAIEWPSQVSSRQALSFLRVFSSGEPLDGTLIHPEDYPLAKKLAGALGIELPPSVPPGYQPPNYAAEEKPVAVPAAADVNKLEPVAVEGIEVESFPEVSELDASPSSETAEPVAEESATSDVMAESAAAGEETTAESEAVEASDAPVAEAPAAESKPLVHEPVRHPLPEKAKIDKCIKEWQIGPKRTHQIVNWLCDPFGDTDASGVPPAVLSTMPSLTTLKPGDQVIGVVVGVMPFGVFVELAPDCSGLIHVSKVSEAYVEDLHEAVQVGDVITTWVSRIDEKRRRVALSAISPERELELEQQRNNRDDRDRDYGPRPPRGDRAAGGRPASPRGDARPAQGGNRPAAGAGAGALASGGRGGARPDNRGGGGAARGGDNRGGRGEGRVDNRGDGRGGQRSRDNRDSRGGGGRGRERKPESYRVESSEPKSAPISEAMEKGVEPLRSFGDLMQFYKKKDPATEKAEAKAEADAKAEKKKEAEARKAQAASEAKAAESNSTESSASDSHSVTPAKPEASTEANAGREETPAATDVPGT